MKYDHRPSGVQNGRAHVGRGSTTPARELLDSVVYAVHLDTEIVIGASSNLNASLRMLRKRSGSRRLDLLGFTPGTKADADTLGHQLAEHRTRGLTYFRPTAAVLAAVEQMQHHPTPA